MGKRTIGIVILLVIDIAGNLLADELACLPQMVKNITSLMTIIILGILVIKPAGEHTGQKKDTEEKTYSKKESDEP